MPNKTKIEYYKTECMGTIHKHSIDTEDKNYIFHTDDTVTIKDTYIDHCGEERGLVLTHSRIFEAVKQQQIAEHKDAIGGHQRSLEIFENSKDYDHYRSLVKYFYENN